MPECEQDRVKERGQKRSRGKLPAENEKPEQKGQDIEAQYERCDRRVEPVRRCEGQTGRAAGDDAGWQDKGDDRKGIQGVSKQNQENPEQIF